MIEILRTPRCSLYHGDAKDLDLPANSVDAIVMDPPSGIGFMNRTWDSDRGGRDAWIDWLITRLGPTFTALKPGGHALSWALPRTSHWTATALEDSGFEIRDIHMHIFGQGFPKSLDVSKAIDAKLGKERPVVGVNPNHRAVSGVNYEGIYAGGNTGSPMITAAGSPEASQWAGWGTALKPAAEHWILCRKPLAGTVAANVLQYGTGGLNVNACRIGDERITTHSRGDNGAFPKRPSETSAEESGRKTDQRHVSTAERVGRWPAHVSFDEEAAAVLDEQTGVLKSGAWSGKRNTPKTKNAYGNFESYEETPRAASEGGASRFFYVAKPSRREKEAGLDHLPAGASGVRNCHETVKSIALMRWLIRLITPPGGVVLDPFAGSGSTGVAAILEGASFIGVENDERYLPILKGRLEHALRGATR